MSSKWSPLSWFKNDDETPVSATNDKQTRQGSSGGLKNELTTLLDDAFSSFNPDGSPVSAISDDVAPGLELQESEKRYTVAVEVCGISEEHLHISLEADTLTIAETKPQAFETERSFLVEGDSPFYRVINLPVDAERGDIKAKLANGVLTLSIGKQERSEAFREIEISKE